MSYYSKIKCQEKTIKENSEKICDLQTSINFKIKELQYLDVMCKEKVKVLVKKIDSPKKETNWRNYKKFVNSKCKNMSM